MSMLEGALARAAEGWRVIPINVGAKKPVYEGWQHLATRDPDQIAAWWTINEWYNVGTVVGEDIVVVDVDIRESQVGDQSLERILQEYSPMPPTRVHRTSSGGWHYIFRRPGDWDIYQGPLNPEYPGIDIKTGNAVILLPPSHTRASDRSAEGDYTVEDETLPAIAPDWVEALRNAGRASTRTVVSANPGGAVGDRNNTLTRMAGRLRRQGQDAQAIFDQLMAVNATWARPLREYEVRTIARSAERWEPAPLGGLNVEFRDKPQLYVTDATAARWLVMSQGLKLKYISDQAEWMGWDGKRWARDPQLLTDEMGLALATMRDECRGLDDTSWQKHAGRSLIRTLETAVGQAGCWKVAPGEAAMSVRSSDLDANPYYLNCENGIIDLQTGILKPHNRSALQTHLAPTTYDPHADVLEWETFVLWCCSGDAEQAAWLKVMMGQALIGAQQEHSCVFMFGTGGNGKTQLTDAIRITLGSYALESTADLITVKGKDSLHTETVASLFGKRFVICPEPDKGTHWNAGRVKDLNGGQTLRARHLYGREFSFPATHTMVVHGNHRPEIRDHSEGFRRRIHLVPFSNQVLPENRVVELGAKLAGPGVLRWLVEGAITYQRNLNRLATSQRVAIATGDYLDEQNHMHRWLNEWCELDPEAWESSGDLYSTYQYWCRAEGIMYIETKQALSGYLQSRGFKPRMREIHGRKVRGYQGVRLVRATEPNTAL